MLVKILGALDLLAGAILIVGLFTSPPKIIFLIFGIIILLKAFPGIFTKDFASWVDTLCGVFLILSIFFSFPIWLGMILGIWIFQKGFFSFL